MDDRGLLERLKLGQGALIERRDDDTVLKACSEVENFASSSVWVWWMRWAVTTSVGGKKGKNRVADVCAADQEEGASSPTDWVPN